ncbi:MAG: methylenetetrahydrofolate--tRNA-(uracil(54)-C(5))-methyltransferase (FADH(2)-oxidizing) TrmFO [Chloroflexi bacterium]|nr:methylenetetrahydrofolate--tRNA-(uracil(54)-C(5))-methyltransferase (FADH(2)-oxidizing) TrmFO [Chloroflexota bacterium]
MPDLIVVGGGLAGSEAAWQAAQRGLKVRLYEMRPRKMTPAHTTGYLAELVCSNSLGTTLIDRAGGLLKEELRRMGSLLLPLAEASAVPAGSALAVDRNVFAQKVTEALESHPNIEVVREEVTDIPQGLSIIASGPLTSNALSQAIARLTGQEHLYFFDAIAPIVVADSINMDICFRGARYGRSATAEGDYINCPMDKAQYEAFVDALVRAERIELHDFERFALQQGVRAGKSKFFEGCLPIEVMAQRGKDALRFGPLRPTGLIDPRTGREPYAVVQLRQDNLAGTLYNMVGFQTNLKFPEQRRVFRMIPGLEQAEFARYGQMHRNTFIFSPALLDPTLQFRTRPDLFFAGQITGVEGYVGNIATGLLAGWNAARLARGQEPLVLPRETMLGALLYYITHASEHDFQPMKANFGLLPPLPRRIRDKRARGRAYAERALQALEAFLAEVRAQGDGPVPPPA